MQNRKGEQQPAEKNKTPEKRTDYEKPKVTKRGNLKEITSLSFEPPA
jgi:hypothetical protein